MELQERLKGLLNGFREMAVGTGNPLIILVMGFISDILLIIYNTGEEGSVGRRVAKVLAFAMREFEVELRKVVNESPTEYDDKFVDELFEVVDQILQE